jgi:hypothetical protein
MRKELTSSYLQSKGGCKKVSLQFKNQFILLDSQREPN